MNKSLTLIATLAALVVALPVSAKLVRHGDLVTDTDLKVDWTRDANLFATQLAANANLVTDILALTPSVIDPVSGDPHTITADEFKTDTSDAQNLGRMTWFAAQAWVIWLNAMDSGAGYLGHTDWRLPQVQPKTPPNFVLSDGNECLGDMDVGYNQTGLASELAHLFYNELKNKAKRAPTDFDCFTDRTVYGLKKTRPFINLKLLIQETLPVDREFWSQTSVPTGVFLMNFDDGFQSVVAPLDINGGASPVYHAWPVRGPGPNLTVGDYDIAASSCSGKVDKAGRTVKLKLTIANSDVLPVKTASVTVNLAQGEATYTPKTKTVRLGRGKTKVVPFVFKTKASGDATFSATLTDEDSSDGDTAQDTAECTITTPQ